MKNLENSNKKSHIAKYTKRLKSKKKSNKVPTVHIQGKFNRVKLKSSLLKLSSIYNVQKIWVKLLIITIVSIFSGIIGDLLLQNTGLYTVGIEAFAQGVARLISFSWHTTIETKEVIRNIFFWGLIIVVNIPLLIFGWFKVGKSFTLYSTFYVVVSSLFGLSFGFINGIENIFIFANTSNIISEHYLVQVIPWDSTNDSSSQLSLFIYGIIYGIIQAILYSILFILDCSSAGLDMIIVWYSEKKYKNIGTIFTYFNILFFVVSYIIGTYIPVSLTLSKDLSHIETNPELHPILQTKPWEAGLLFSPNFMATLLMSLVLGITLNNFFPKYQMSRIEIVSRKVNEIRDELINSEKPYALSINTIEGGYSKLPQKVLITNCTYIEAPTILKIVRKYDPNALFVLTLIKNIDGYIYLASKDEEKTEWKFFSWFKKFSKKENDDKDTEVREIGFEVDNNLVTENVIEKLVEDEIIAKDDESNNITSQKVLKVIEASEIYDEKLEEKVE